MQENIPDEALLEFKLFLFLMAFLAYSEECKHLTCIWIWRDSFHPQSSYLGRKSSEREKEGISMTTHGSK